MNIGCWQVIKIWFKFQHPRALNRWSCWLSQDTSCGTWPVKWLLSKVRLSSSLRFDSSFGRAPGRKEIAEMYFWKHTKMHKQCWISPVPRIRPLQITNSWWKFWRPFSWSLSLRIHISVHHSPLANQTLQSNHLGVGSKANQIAPVKLLFERSKSTRFSNFPTSGGMVPDKVLPFNCNLAGWRKWMNHTQVKLRSTVKVLRVIWGQNHLIWGWVSWLFFLPYSGFLPFPRIAAKRSCSSLMRGLLNWKTFK